VHRAHPPFSSWTLDQATGGVNPDNTECTNIDLGKVDTLYIVPNDDKGRVKIKLDSVTFPVPRHFSKNIKKDNKKMNSCDHSVMSSRGWDSSWGKISHCEFGTQCLVFNV
jgi:hypothetical protein